MQTTSPPRAGYRPGSVTNPSHHAWTAVLLVLLGLSGSPTTAWAADTPVEPAAPETAAEAAAEAATTEPAAEPTPDFPTVPAAARPPTATASGSETIEGMLQQVQDDLADMQQMIDAGELELPEAWLSARIGKIQKSSHRFDPQLVRPLILLGDIEAQRGNTVEALDRYGEALHIERVSSGLVSPDQVEIVHREANVYRRLGDLKNANEREEYAYHVLRRAFQPYDIDMLPGAYRLAAWYTETRNIFAARRLYQHCVDILTANGLGDSTEAIPALEGLVDTYKLERFPPVYLTSETIQSYGTGLASSSQFDAPVSVGYLPDGEKALQQIVQIRRDNGNDPQQVADAVLELADWYLLFDKPRRALPLYDYAYDLLDSIESVDAVAYFSAPKLLHYPAPNDPSPPQLGSTREAMTGFVQLSFDVTEEGYVRSLQTLASEPDGMMDFRARKSMRASRYRPSIVDGVPVKTEGQTYRHEFTYYPAATETAQETAARGSVQ